MIKNERQYHITKSKLKKFNEAIKIIEETQNDEDPLLVKLQLDSIRSQIEVFEIEIAEFEKLKSGEIDYFSTDIFNLSEGIINSRIAKGLNHKELGDLLGVSEQQVQKYESENYKGTSLNRLQEIISILGIRVETIFKLSQDDSLDTNVDFLIPEDLNICEIRKKIKRRQTTFEICP
jgi:HTH-type transcriptional regulator/antitoxin HigA